MLRFEDARARLLDLGAALRRGSGWATERVTLDDALGRVLAEDVVATADVPAFDYSAMDGYAVRASDLAGGAPITLPVVGESRTGSPAPPLTAGSVMRIFTGAPLPEGADAVVMQEDVRRTGDRATFREAPPAGKFVRHRGDDLRAGTIALRGSTRLRAPHLALAASLDRPTLTVARRPVVAILATGDELRKPGTPPRPGSIAESVTVALRAMVRRAEATCLEGPYVPDDRAIATRAFAEALDQADVVLSVGGVSVGDHDVVRPALEAAGVTLDFWRVAIKPGKPLAIGTRSGPGRACIAVGLPGNPASAMVTAALFAVPLLRALQGDRAPLPVPTRARLAHAVRREPGRMEFARATLSVDAQGFVARLGDNQASGAVTSMTEADALVCIDADAARLEPGDAVSVLLLREYFG